MRDPARIPGTLAAVQRLWRDYPGLRLGQLLWFIADGDPFHEEDGVLVTRCYLKLAERRQTTILEDSE